MAYETVSGASGETVEEEAMAVEFISVKCPECGANLNIEEDREQAFCTYCGTKILLHNENERVYRRIDEAGIKQAETDRIIRLREIELAEKKYSDAKKRERVYFGMLLIGVVLFVASFVANDARMFGLSDGLLLSSIGLMVVSIILIRNRTR